MRSIRIRGNNTIWARNFDTTAVPPTRASATKGQEISEWKYRGSPTSTVSTSTNSTSTIFSAIGIKLVLVEFLALPM